MGSALNGNGACGMTRPFKVAAVNGGFVALAPKATLACPLVANVEAWFMEAVQPAAMAWFGSPVTEIKQISAYSCRTMNGQPGASISEHAFGNALDVASFRFADGREVKVQHGWKGQPEERGFLRSVHAAACERFSTVLAPGADMFHYDHIHVDLARRASGRNVCKPAPVSPVPPALRPPQPELVARAPSPPSTSPWSQPMRQADGGRARAPSQPSTSPWAQPAPQPAQASMTGPNVIARQPARQDAGAPLVLGNPAPPTNSFGAPLPIAERVRQALGTLAPVQQAPAPPPPAPHPGYQNPHGLVPPGRVPNARLGADPTVTGSIAGTNRKGEAVATGSGKVNSSLIDPQSIAEQKPSSEAASVFDLPAVAKGR